jgi:arginine repressor
MAFGDQIPNSFITQFESEVKIAYGQAAKLRPAVRTVTGTTGSTVRFPRLLTEFTAQAKAAGADLTYNDPQHSNATATLTDRYVPALVEEMDQLKTNVDLRGTYARHIANALAKIHDKDILTTLAGWDAITSPVTTPVTFDISSGNIMDSLVDASAQLNNNNVPMSDRYFVVKAGFMSTFLKTDKAISGDYNSVKALVNGTLSSYVGFQWIMLPDDYFVDADTVGFCVHKDAVGAGIGSDMKVRIDWVPQKVAYQVLGTLSMGSAIIDAKGVVEINSQA